MLYLCFISPSQSVKLTWMINARNLWTTLTSSTKPFYQKFCIEGLGLILISNFVFLLDLLVPASALQLNICLPFRLQVISLDPTPKKKCSWPVKNATPSTRICTQRWRTLHQLLQRLAFLCHISSDSEILWFLFCDFGGKRAMPQSIQCVSTSKRVHVCKSHSVL